jgi:hypothetical protein
MERIRTEDDSVACGNCKFVHYELTTGGYFCWKSPPMPAGAFMPGPRGEVKLQVGSMRPPVAATEHCGEFVRKIQA